MSKETSIKFKHVKLTNNLFYNWGSVSENKFGKQKVPNIALFYGIKNVKFQRIWAEEKHCTCITFKRKQIKNKIWPRMLLALSLLELLIATRNDRDFVFYWEIFRKWEIYTNWKCIKSCIRTCLVDPCCKLNVRFQICYWAISILL